MPPPIPLLRGRIKEGLITVTDGSGSLATVTGKQTFPGGAGSTVPSQGTLTLP